MQRIAKRFWTIMLATVFAAALVPVMPAMADDIQIGEYVQMGTYYGDPILWRCVDIDDNGPLMLSDKIICLKAFDAKGENTLTGSHGRTDETSRRPELGSNYWGDSNIRSWLNSTAEAGNVEWLCGNPPDDEHLWNGYCDYDQEAGFLTNFSQTERNAMKEVSQKQILAYPETDAGMATEGTALHEYKSNIKDVVTNFDDAYAEYLTDKMFLLDVKQICAVYNNGSVLGEDYYIGETTEKCVDNSKFKVEGNLVVGKWHSWLRSPYSAGFYVRYVDCSTGWVSGTIVDHADMGVRPAFYLNEGVSLSGGGTSENPFTVGGGTGEKIIQVTGGYAGKLEFTVGCTENTVTVTASGDLPESLRVYVASYSGGALGGVTALESTGDGIFSGAVTGENYKIFIWDENLAPVTYVYDSAK